MTTYSTTAIATNSVDNTVTVASIANMFPGLPITFSGTTFGGITQGSTYYIGTIIYGYPTSTITLNSLPGGAVFALSNGSGSMTATWESGGQLIIDTDPPGESLNSAFTKINVNFDQIFAAGPVNSNIRIADNTIYSLDTNGDLILNPNGIGNVVANAHVVPDQTLIRNLGSPTRVWNEIYVQYANVGNLDPSSITIPVADFHLLGGNNGQFLQTNGSGNLTWSNPEASAGGDNTQVQFNNNGVLDGSESFVFNANSNTVTIQNVTTTGVANLNSVGNIFISGGVAGYVLQTDGQGNLSWTIPTGNITSILDQQIFGDGSTLSFTLITPSVTNAVIVSLNGVLQIPEVAYSVLSDTITFTEAPQTNDLVDIRFLIFGASPDNFPGGADGFIQFNSGGTFGGSGNLRYYANTGNLYSSNVSVSGNITAGYYYGDGSYLTGITATANTGTITFANNVISTSNANAAINIVAPQSTPVSMAAGGNTATAQMLWATNIGALSPEQLNNGVLNGNTWGTQISVGNTGAVIGSNSVAGLKTWTFKTDGTFSGTGSVVAGNVTSTTDVTATANVSAVGNVLGSYFIGNGSQLTGLPVAYGNANVAAYLNGSIGNIIPVANIAYSLGNATNQWLDLWVSNATIYMNSVPITLGAGNVLSVAGSPVVTVTSNSVANIGNFVFNGNSLQNTNNPSFNNGSLTNGSTAGLSLPTNGNVDPTLLYNIYGNAVVQTGSNSDVTAAWTFRNNGNLALPGGGQLGDTYGDGANNAGLQAGPGGYAIINSNNLQQYVQADDTGVYVGTDFPGNSFSWVFDKTGNLTLPNNGSPSINYANGLPYGGGGGTNTGNIRFSGGNIYNLEGNSQGILIGSTQGAGLDGSIYLPYQSANSALTITNDSGTLATIELAIGNSSWTLDYSGNLTLPSNVASINYANGSPYGAVDVDTGNIGFVGDSIYDINGIYLQNANLTTPATAAVILPANGNVGNVQLNNTYGNLLLQSGASGSLTASWQLSNNGNVVLPGGGIIGDTFGDGANNAGIQAGPGGYAVINSANQQQYVQADNTAVYIGTNHGVTNTIWAFDNTGNLTLPGNTSSINYANGQPYGGNSANPFDQDLNTTDSVTFVAISATGNISGADYVSGNFFVGDGSGLSNITVTANTGNVTFNNSTIVGPSFGNVPSANSSVYIQPTIDAANVYQFSGSALSAPGAISAVGNVTGNYVFGNASSMTGVATQTTGSWTLAPGVNTVSFTVTGGYTYSMWVNGNIPNGIVAWTAMATVTNSNVPVIGVQYGWYYLAGNALVLTSMPDQFVGTAGTISTATAGGATNNVFTFGITNNSGTSQVVNWGYTRL
jgi:hypothetical protein